MSHDLPGEGMQEANERPQFTGHREGDQEVGARQELVELLVEPLAGLVSLTAGTMPVAAGAGHHVELAAGVTAVQDCSQFPGPAAFQQGHDLQLVPAHAGGEFLYVWRAARKGGPQAGKRQRGLMKRCAG